MRFNFLSSVFFILLFFGFYSQVSAQPGDCANYGNSMCGGSTCCDDSCSTVGFCAQCVECGCTSNSNCGSGQVCCQGQCVANGDCGGGQVRECSAPRKSCPAGYKIGAVEQTTCGGEAGCGPIGNAQAYGDCCGYTGGTRECGDWYSCPKPANPDRMCRDCVEEPLECVRNTLYTYECVPDCTAGTTPTLTTPANAAIYSAPSGSTSVTFDWDAPSSWGVEASGTNRSYTLCVGTNSSNPCTGGSSYTVGTGSNPVSVSSQTVTFGTKYWNVKANNMCGATSASSTVRNICVEGHTLPGDAGVGNAYYSQWSACNANTHKRTRTCAEDCGTDNCTAAAAAGLLEEDCTAEIRGTIFDATNLSSCPSFDPNTGYLIGVDTTLTANNRAFSMTDQSAVPTHPWSLITPSETGSGGNYSVRVYAPATYAYDFSDLNDIYIVSTGPKLTCTSAAAVVPGSPTNCGTQPCTIVNNMSFGFERYWGGWWQVQGASVHAETGLRSSIPAGLVSEQSLILPEPAMGNRRGVASYGIASDTMLGVNTNAKVSTSLWEALSNYDGVIYDYAYFNQQFKQYTSTTWDGVSPIVYDDNGNGYQIFKVTGSVTDFNYNPTGTQKVIFLISGDVTINANIVVPNGAFLAVLSGGTISFGTSVTSVDGWYLADNISIRCVDANTDSECDRTDVQFVGNGSFVGWGSIILSRDRGGDTNILGPSEKFNYRMDLYNNAPDPMKIFTKKYKPYVP